MTIKNETHNSQALQQLIKEDAVGQLRRRDGLMAMLGSEDGALKLDWVEGVARLLEDDTKLEKLEAEARENMGAWYTAYHLGRHGRLRHHSATPGRSRLL